MAVKVMHITHIFGLLVARTAAEWAYPFDPDWAQHELGASAGDGLGTLVLLKQAAVQSGAKCLDGSPSGYYLRPGSGDGVSKWYIHHEGGGWCADLDDCVGRSKTRLGTSTQWSSKVPLGGGYWSQDRRVNPMMYNWNFALLKYCDGGSFSGANASVTLHNGAQLHFRGKAILEAMQQDLLARGLSKATDVVISGCSAGGLATYLHVDSWASLLQPTGARVVAMPDSGFFVDYQGLPGAGHRSDCEGHYHAALRWVFQYMNSSSGVHQKCIEAHEAAGDTWKCMFAEHTAPHIATPTFPLQSEYDSWQIQCELFPAHARLSPSKINEYGKNLTSLVNTNLIAASPHHGIFLDSCYHHCGGWGVFEVGGKSSAEAFQEWYEKGSAALPSRGYFAQSKTYPCTNCCHPATREGEPLSAEEEVHV